MNHQNSNNFRGIEEIETVLISARDDQKSKVRLTPATYHPPLAESINGRQLRFKLHSGERMSEKTISSTQFWVGIVLAILTVLATGVGASWTISNSINDKSNSVKKDLSDGMNATRLELMGRLDRLEDKTEAGFKNTSEQLNDIKILLVKSERQDTNKK